MLSSVESAGLSLYFIKPSYYTPTACGKKVHHRLVPKQQRIKYRMRHCNRNLTAVSSGNLDLDLNSNKVFFFFYTQHKPDPSKNTPLCISAAILYWISFQIRVVIPWVGVMYIDQLGDNNTVHFFDLKVVSYNSCHQLNPMAKRIRNLLFCVISQLFKMHFWRLKLWWHFLTSQHKTLHKNLKLNRCWIIFLCCDWEMQMFQFLKHTLSCCIKQLFSWNTEPGQCGQYDTVTVSPLRETWLLPSVQSSPLCSHMLHFIEVCFILTDQAHGPWALIVQYCKTAPPRHCWDRKPTYLGWFTQNLVMLLLFPICIWAGRFAKNAFNFPHMVIAIYFVIYFWIPHFMSSLYQYLHKMWKYFLYYSRFG